MFSSKIVFWHIVCVFFSNPNAYLTYAEQEFSQNAKIHTKKTKIHKLIHSCDQMLDTNEMFVSCPSS